MQEKTELSLMFYFTVAYMFVFTVIAIINRNYEFLYYTLYMTAALIFVTLFYKKMNLSKTVLFGLTVLGAIHIFGGNINIFGTRLYDLWLIPAIFKYDNLVHAFGYFVITFAIYDMISPHFDGKIKQNKIIFSIILVLIASGIGACAEIAELGAVVFFNAAEKVGDYMNNALDLVFNLLGAIIACVVIVKYYKLQQSQKIP
jgi:hypothetical protein